MDPFFDPVKSKTSTIKNCGTGNNAKCIFRQSYSEGSSWSAFKVKDKVYIESGLIMKNLIRIKLLNMYYIGFGIGTFYRYGYYALDNTLDNFALKLSVSISLK